MHVRVFAQVYILNAIYLIDRPIIKFICQYAINSLHK